MILQPYGLIPFGPGPWPFGPGVAAPLGDLAPSPDPAAGRSARVGPDPGRGRSWRIGPDPAAGRSARVVPGPPATL